MERSIRASPADKANRQSQTAAPVPRRGAFLCSLRLNCCRSGPIRPTGGTPERRNTQKAPARTAHIQAHEWPQTMAARGIVPQHRPDLPDIRETPGGNRAEKLFSLFLQFNYTPNRPILSICILYKIEPCNLSIFTLFISVHLWYTVYGEM